MPTFPILCVAAPLTVDGIRSAMSKLQVDQATLWTILHVETAGCGYFPSRRPQILFERHVFSHLTQGRWDRVAGDISNPQPGGYGARGDSQYSRLARAYSLDASTQSAALQSTSWGLGQILGTNFASAGFQSIVEVASAMAASEDEQLKATTAFLLANHLEHSLRAHDWAAYARGYNGPDFAKNAYDTKLAEAHANYQNAGRLPNLDVRAGQLALMFLGYFTGQVDGILGAHSLDALHRFQTEKQLPLTNQIDAGVLSSLTATLPPAANLFFE
jgi:hypothetical protein